jgi:hypothetical protein
VKTTLTEGTFHGRKVFRFVAVIPKNVEHGIKRKLQKTWRIDCDHSKLDTDIKRMFNSEAQRWLVKKMTELFPSGAPQHLTQMEIPNEPDDKSDQGPAVPGVSEA